MTIYAPFSNFERPHLHLTRFYTCPAAPYFLPTLKRQRVRHDVEIQTSGTTEGIEFPSSGASCKIGIDAHSWDNRSTDWNWRWTWASIGGELTPTLYFQPRVHFPFRKFGPYNAIYDASKIEKLILSRQKGFSFHAKSSALSRQFPSRKRPYFCKKIWRAFRKAVMIFGFEVTNSHREVRRVRTQFPFIFPVDNLIFADITRLTELTS